MKKLSSYQKLKLKNKELKAEITKMERIIARGDALEKIDLKSRCMLKCDMADTLWYGKKDPEGSQKSRGIMDTLKQ